MYPITTLAAAAVLLLTAACTADRVQASQPTATASQPSSPAPASHAPASSTPARPTAPPAPSATSTSAARAVTSTAVPAPRTQQIVLRPVTDTGRAAPGYTTVVLSATHRIDCGGSSRSHASPSPVTVDAGPVACGPSSEYALACWNGPAATTALCYQNPWQRQVVEVRADGRLPALPAPSQPSPLGLVLSDGTRCSLRDGGAWAALDGHPDLLGSYSCQGLIAVWANSHSDGIERSRTLWSVRVAPMSGHGQLHPMTVRTAYFVGTSRS